METILIVGAGLSGSTLANRLANIYNVIVIDKREHIGGNCYDYYDQDILMNKYGAHIFHTNNDKVWKYVNKFCEWIPWKHKVVGKINTTYFPIPVNIDTVNTLLNKNLDQNTMNDFIRENNKLTTIHPINSEQVAIENVGHDLYNLIFKQYTYKQWNKYPAELDKSVLSRIPIRNNYNPYYFNDKYEALPKHGYTYFIKKMLDHPNITVKLNTEYTEDMKQEQNYSKIFFTGPIDHYYSELNLPKLEYRSINFVKEYHDIDYYQSNSVINYPLCYSSQDNIIKETPWTRIIEYKHFYNQNVPNKTIIVKEYTTNIGDPYYPVPTKRNQDLYLQYQKEAIKDEVNNIYFLGRLGSYKYLNMDQAIDQALLLAERILSNTNIYKEHIRTCLKNTT